jgi:hypothetical protein
VPYDEAYDHGFEDMPRRVPDVRKLEAAIAFKPSTPLEDIIDDVIADQRKHRMQRLASPLPAGLKMPGLPWSMQPGHRDGSAAAVSRVPATPSLPLDEPTSELATS